MTTATATKLKNPFTAVRNSEGNHFRPWEVALPGVGMPLTRFAKRAEAVAAKNALNAWHAAGGDQHLEVDVATFIGRYEEYVDVKDTGTTVFTPWIIKHFHELLKVMREVVQEAVRGAGT